jgi:enterochelin esterase-like enzyme
VREIAGGHDWAAWRRLWDDFLVSTREVLQ